VRIGVDTNVLAYAEGLDDGSKVDQALFVLRKAYLAHDLVFPTQVLAELFRVLVRKGRMPAGAARLLALGWRDKGDVEPTAQSTLELALDLAVLHRLQTFDALILAAASQAGCRLLLSEDFQDGFTWGGVTVVNPFASSVHPLLEHL
jgi:predicted nucleic acid-binding protein